MATNFRLRNLVWWRRWSSKDWALAISVFALSIFALSLLHNSSIAQDSQDPPLSAVDFVDLTLLHRANDRAALCLDGSVPGYHFQKGFGSGSRNWLLHIEGGGWCNTPASCSLRKKTALGSSDSMDRRVRFSGILSSDSLQNPDFYNWNKVKIRYCDGASFSGHPEAESQLKDGTKLFFRGQLIWDVLMEELLSIGLSKAKQALLSGCSAGGLATLIHCDDFRNLLPKDVTVKCLADAGFFLNEKDVLGNHTMRSFYHDVILLQGVAKSLQKDCVSSLEPSECIFPQQIIKNINTPVFLVNPAYDFWQIQHILVPEVADPHGYWRKCRLNIHNCNRSQIQILQGFRDSFLMALSDFGKKKDGGMFINSCFSHCQTSMTETWHFSNSPKINSKTIAESVGDWYFGRNVSKHKHIDCPHCSGSLLAEVHSLVCHPHFVQLTSEDKHIVLQMELPCLSLTHHTRHFVFSFWIASMRK